MQMRGGRGVVALFAGAAFWAPVSSSAQTVPAPLVAEPVFNPTLIDLAGRPTGMPGAEIKEVTNLPEAITVLYERNPQLLAQRATLRSTNYQVPAARAAFGPQLTVTGSHGYAYDRTDLTRNLALPQSGWSSTASAIVTQPIFTSGRATSAERAALAQVAFQRDTLRLVESQLLLSALNAYISVQRDTAFVDIAQQNLALLERQYLNSRERFDVRDITASDLEQVRTRFEAGEAQLISARGQLAVSRAQFVQIVGAAPSAKLAPPVLLSVPFVDLSSAYLFTESNSPVIRTAQSREKISRAAIEQAKAEQGADVALRGSANSGPVSPYGNSLRAQSLRGEIVVSVPLIDGGLRQARVDGAREANQADWLLIDQALREVRETVGSNWNQLAAARASLQHYAAASDAARKAYEGALIQEKAGARTTLDTLDLARDLLTIRNSYVSVLANENLARANLLAVSGLLEASRLIPGIAGYDPEKDFRRAAHRGDWPGLTTAVSGLDSLIVGDVASDRPIRDPSASVRVDSAVDLLPESVVPANPETVIEVSGPADRPKADAAAPERN